MRNIVAAFVMAVIVAGVAVALADAGPADKGKTIRVEMLLPRFKGVLNDFKSHPGLKKSLHGVPAVLKAEDMLFGFGFHTAKRNESVSGFMTRITFDPAKGDVGDIAKAVSSVKAAEERQKNAAAILLIFPEARKKLTDDDRERVWKSLKGVKGVDIEESRKLLSLSAFGIVLDGAGGAKFQEISDAFKSAGLPIQAR